MRLSPFHVLAFSLSGALITGAMLTGVLVPAERHSTEPKIVRFERSAPCATCWDRAAVDRWMRNGQDGAIVRL